MYINVMYVGKYKNNMYIHVQTEIFFPRGKGLSLDLIRPWVLDVTDSAPMTWVPVSYHIYIYMKYNIYILYLK